MSLVFYISPSILPSRSANSIHVVSMCEGIAKLKHSVLLFSATNTTDSFNSNKTLVDFYGVSGINIKVVPYYSRGARGVEIGIALKSLLKFIIVSIKGNKPSVIISRNLYSAVFLGLLFRQKIVYETHSPEYGYRRRLQKWLLNSSKILTVVISEALKNVICEFHSVDGKSIYIFHDAARAGRLQSSSLQRKELKDKLLRHVVELEQYKKCVGYFGHLYPGRGIEVIQGIAKKNPEYAFIVYGGNDKEIKYYFERNIISNLFFMGHISPNLVHSAMSMMDVLLMPYQKSVSVGLENVDTAKWMSPMKMFEYLSVGVPIISSDISVLREILVSGDNSILVTPDDIDEWSNALQDIIANPVLANNLGSNAYYQYKSKHTWDIRARNMINLCDADAS